jgi:Carboxymuconolactone decarboxylase family.
MNTISRFPIPSLDALPEDIRSRIVAVQEKAGFIPNVFLAWAHRPEEFRAFFAYHDALLEKPGGLSKAEREMIVVAPRRSITATTAYRARRDSADPRQAAAACGSGRD